MTWNTLHRIHAVNWSEAPVASYPDERVRITAIADVIARWIASDVDAVCLQEVSGDQLAQLRRVLGGAQGAGIRVLDHVYPRIPRLRGGETSELDDPTEHLVVVVKAADARVTTARTFDSDPGKGFLAVAIGGGATIIDTHVTFGDRGHAQLALLGEVARASGRSAILGDFNAPADVVRTGLGAGVAVSDVQAVTRIATNEHAGKTIDHVAVIGGAIRSVSVLDGQGLSDHHPVVADVGLG